MLLLPFTSSFLCSPVQMPRKKLLSFFPEHTQSDLHLHHVTEAAFVKITGDVDIAKSSGPLDVPIFIYLSEALDIIDQSCLHFEIPFFFFSCISYLNTLLDIFFRPQRPFFFSLPETEILPPLPLPLNTGDFWSSIFVLLLYRH